MDQAQQWSSTVGLFTSGASTSQSSQASQSAAYGLPWQQKSWQNWQDDSHGSPTAPRAPPPSPDFTSGTSVQPSWTSDSSQQHDASATQPPSDSVSAQPAVPQSAGAIINDAVLQRVLDMHNSLRAKHGVGALSWSSELQNSAQRWADGCAFEHSHSGVGENLGLNYPDFSSVVQSWYDEIYQYNYQSGGFSAATGHATQLLWKGTAQLGCGYQTSCGLYVCQYNPAGNVIGQFQDNVFAPVSR